MNSPANMITRRSYHENKTENYRRHFPHAGSDGCNLQRGRQRQCHERRMGHYAGAGHRCSEPHRDTQDRTEHQGTGSIHRQHCRKRSIVDA